MVLKKKCPSATHFSAGESNGSQEEMSLCYPFLSKSFSNTTWGYAVQRKPPRLSRNATDNCVRLWCFRNFIKPAGETPQKNTPGFQACSGASPALSFKISPPAYIITGFNRHFSRIMGIGFRFSGIWGRENAAVWELPQQKKQVNTAFCLEIP